jgi:uncharacterized damage-inducible protein DinB
MIQERQFDAIRRLKDETLAGLSAWSDAQLRYKPSPAEWSALEIVDHLARTDAGITRQMQINLAAPMELTLAGRAAATAFNLMFRSPVRVKTPKEASAILPICPPDLATASSNWDEAIGVLRNFLSELQAEPEGGLFKHPVAGPMSLATGLEFIEVHTRHHLHQLARLRKAASAVA